MTNSKGSLPNAPKIASRVSPKEPLIVAALIVAVSVAVAVGGIVFKTKDALKNDRIELMADANAKQVAPLRRVVQGRLQQDRTRLVQFAATRSTLGPGRARAYGDFALVAMVLPSAGGQWTVQWTEKGPLYMSLQSDQNMLTYEQEIALLRSLPYDRIREGDVHWQRLSDANGRPIWTMAVAVETQSAPAGTTPANASLPDGIDYQSVQVGTGGKAVVVGFFGRNPLLSATEDFIGSTSTAFVIDSRGYAASHSNKVMVGALLKDDPSVKEVFSARSSAGATRYNNAQGTTVFSAFEQVDRANLYVVMATPDVVTGVSSKGFGQTAIMTGVFAFIVGLVLVVAWGGRLIPRITSDPTASEPRLMANDLTLQEFGRPNAARLGVPVDGRTELEFPDEAAKFGSPANIGFAGKATEDKRSMTAALAKEKSEYVHKVVEGLERTMREPLLAALAHVQLLKSKAADQPSPDLLREITDHVSSIDRDLRQAKELIDSLARLSSTTSVHLENDRQDLKSIVSDLADHERSRLESEGIVFDVQAPGVPKVSGRPEFTKQALLEVLENARRALQGRSGKTLKVKLEDKGDSLVLSISDNGIGMTRDIRSQAFEPFAKEFDLPNARGLGLSYVRTTVQASGGSVELVSSPGEGTTLIMRWPVAAAERREFQKELLKIQEAEQEAQKLAAKAAAAEEALATEKVQVTSETNEPAKPGVLAMSLVGTGIDFGREGQATLGGKRPLSEEDLRELPPAPLAGEDEDDDGWSFDIKTPILDLKDKRSETAIKRTQEPAEIIIRPVRRD
jgi:signal transduction histidine kinase